MLDQIYVLHAELLDEAEGSLWKRDWIENTRLTETPEEFERVVVAIDPAVSAKKDSDETGIIAAAIDKEGRIYVWYIWLCKAE